MKKIATAFFLLGVLIGSAGATAGLADFAGRPEMNGYRFKDFGDFSKEWRLVTVRFRKDTGEQRFVYANPVAWKAIEANEKVFPNGSIFAKIGMATEEDPHFTSSAVPSGARRYQFMIKDHKENAEGDGWGYALFDAEGVTFPEDPKVQTVSCRACHQIVKDEDFVFSRKMGLAPEKPVLKIAPKAEKPAAPAVEFETVAVTKLPKKAKALLPATYRQVRLVKGELAKSLFKGTLDEIKPALAKEVLRSGLPAGLINKARSQFSIVFVDTSSRACAVVDKGSLNMIAAWTETMIDKDSSTGRPLEDYREEIIQVPFCQSPAKSSQESGNGTTKFSPGD